MMSGTMSKKPSKAKSIAVKKHWEIADLWMCVVETKSGRVYSCWWRRDESRSFQAGYCNGQ